MAVTVYPAPTPAGTNNIGDVDVLTVPALVAGTANIGDVDVLTLPALPAGTANIGDVDVLTLPALPAGTNTIGGVDGDTAHDGVDSGDPVKVGGKAASAAPAAVAAADRVNAWFGLNGQLVVQQKCDIGREQILLFWDYLNAANGTTALTNFTSGTRAGSALGAANNLQVAAGKTLRIQTVIISTAATSSTRPTMRTQIRQAASVANTSPVIWDSRHIMEQIGTLAAEIPGHTYSFEIPDGLEVAAGQQITFTIVAAAVHGKASMTIIGFEYPA